MRPRLTASLLVLVWSASAPAATYYVAKTGSAAATCTAAQNKSTPKQSIVDAIPCLKAGDTLYIRAGVYAEAINEFYVKVPSGTSWNTAVTIAGYPEGILASLSTTKPR